MNVHITGDRGFSPVYMALVPIEMLRVVNEGHTLSCGATHEGVDAIACGSAKCAGVDIAHKDYPGPDDLVVFIHADPMSSTRCAEFADRADDLLRLVTPDDAFV